MPAALDYQRFRNRICGCLIGAENSCRKCVSSELKSFQITLAYGYLTGLHMEYALLRLSDGASGRCLRKS